MALREIERMLFLMEGYRAGGFNTYEPITIQQITTTIIQQLQNVVHDVLFLEHFWAKKSGSGVYKKGSKRYTKVEET